MSANSIKTGLIALEAVLFTTVRTMPQDMQFNPVASSTVAGSPDEAAAGSQDFSGAAIPKTYQEPTWPLIPLSADDRRILDERHAAKLNGKLTLAGLDRSEPISNDPLTPNYYIYHGQAVPMRLDTTRIAVQCRENTAADELEGLLTAAGIAVRAVNSIHVGNWRMLAFETPLKDATEVRARIETMVTIPAVEFATPVFHSPMTPGGWAAMTPGILARLTTDARSDGADVLKSIVPDWRVERDKLGGMAGAYVLRGAVRDGFDVLAAANLLAGDARIEWAEPDCIITGHCDMIPNDPEFNNLWGVHNTGQIANGTAGTNDVDMNGPEAWNITRGESGVRVLIMDNGVQQDHPDLNQDAGQDFTGGQADGVPGGGPMNPCDNHGTAVAGCVSARFNNGTGVVGIAAGCRCVSARLFVSNQPCDGNWTTQFAWTANALNWAVNNGVQITNNSNGYDVTSNAVDAAYDNSENAGLVHFASAGNSGANTIGYPSSIGSVNSVSNVQSDGTLNPGSQHGPGLDFAAPGTNIRTTDRTNSNGYVAGDYVWVSGTSFASPYAAGVAAMVKSVRPNYNAANIELAMTAGARDFGTSGYDTDYGFGFVTAFGAVEAFTPSNDLCNTPMVIPALSWTSPTIYTQNATVSTYYEPFESCEYAGAGVSNSVWFEFTPPGNGTINIDTFGSDYDTVLSVFNGCNNYIYFGGTITPIYAAQIACNDDTNGVLQSQVLNVPVTAGIAYKIKVSDYNQASGGGALLLHFSFAFGVPGNDLCANAYIIPGDATSYNPPVTSTVSATTSNSCNEATSTCGAVGGNGHSVWYQFTPTASGTLYLDTIGSDYDTVLTIFNASTWGCGNYLFNICIYPPEIACNDDLAPGQYQSAIYGTILVHDVTYLIKVASYGAGNGGFLDFNLNYVPSRPNNDDCANATVITGSVFNPVSLDTRGATVAAADLQEDCEKAAGGVSNSVWYRYTPASNGMLTVDTFGSSYDTVLSIFQGTCASAAQIACNDDAAGGIQSQLTGVALLAGAQYLIKVSDYDATPHGGDLLLHFSFSGCDTSIHVQDVPVFIQTLLNPSAAAPCDFTKADANHDGVVNGRDVQPFARALVMP